MKTSAVPRLLAVSCVLFAIGAALPGSSGATAQFSLLTRSDLGIGPQNSLVVADLNRDGVPDLAATNLGSDVSVFLGNGNGTFGPRSSFPTGAAAASVTAGDVNGDTIPDLLVANSSANTVSVLLGVGNGTFGLATDFAASAS